MIQDEISIRSFDSNLTIKIERWSLRGIDYAEELLWTILDSKGVGPIFRLLFGLKLVDRPIWLAPDTCISKFLHNCDRSSKRAELELRMRFRPSSFACLQRLDKVAFDIIFAQIRYDFIYTKFNDDKRDFLLLDDAVLVLIVTDLLRHALEHSININEIFSQVNPTDFIPHHAPRWQKFLLFHNRKHLQEALERALSKSNGDANRSKIAFIELFLTVVCTDYSSEIYEAQIVDSESETAENIDIRIRYSQTSEESNCYVETRPKSKKISKQKPWQRLCDIYSVGITYFHSENILLKNSTGASTLKFKSPLAARSLLSILDGYHRLMINWNLNICSGIHSPDLCHLKLIKSHGAIGWATAQDKLMINRRPGTFLVRRCMLTNYRYLVDVVLDSQVFLTIQIDWCPLKRVYKKTSHTVEAGQVVVSTDNASYSRLSDLINDLQIKTCQKDDNYPPQQLRHWLKPTDNDECPTLLVSMSRTKLIEIEDRDRSRNPITELPKLISTNMIQMTNERISKSTKNKMIVNLAKLNDEKLVALKSYAGDHQDGVKSDEDIVFHICPEDHDQIHLHHRIKSAQIRLTDWVFVKHPLFVETLGINLETDSLIQEYYPLGTVSDFLSTNEKTSDLIKLDITVQISDALTYLQEKRIIHGKLRCHNIFISQYHPLTIKISDPLGTFDSLEDQAFIPPEYLELRGKLCIKKYTSNIDVWAFGTTVWQIYSNGEKPPINMYANTLIQPHNCPDEVWTLVEGCWQIEPSCRATPISLYRDLDSLYQLEREPHSYCNIYKSQSCLDSENPSAENRMSTSGSNGCPSSNDSGSQVDLLSRHFHRINVVRNYVRKGYCQNNNENQSNNPVRKNRWFGVLSSRKRNINKQQLNNEPDETMSRMETTRNSASDCFDTNQSSCVFDVESLSDVVDNPDWYIESNRLRLGVEIGRGTCGIVIKGVLSQSYGDEVVAVKCIDRDSIGDRSKIEDLKKEFGILKQLDHPNIVKTLGFVESSHMMLVMEYMPLGSLLTCIKNSYIDSLQNMPLRKYALDIAAGMKYLEERKIVHRDLALRNILVKNQNQVKICDFGLSQFLGADDHYKLKTDRALPLRWSAPEVLENWIYTHKTDVWSFGIVIWEIYSGGSHPLYSGNYENLLETLKHERLLKPKDCPKDMYDLMLRCWAYNPEERDTFLQIHKFLSESKD